MARNFVDSIQKLHIFGCRCIDAWLFADDVLNSAEIFLIALLLVSVSGKTGVNRFVKIEGFAHL
jgi:hypothetical protein